MHDGLFAN